MMFKLCSNIIRFSFCFRKLKTYWHRFRVGVNKNMVKTRWEEDFELIENEGLFEEYLEMGKAYRTVVAKSSRSEIFQHDFCMMLTFKKLARVNREIIIKRLKILKFKKNHWSKPYIRLFWH